MDPIEVTVVDKDGKESVAHLKPGFVPKGFLTEEAHGTRLRDEVTRRVDGAKANARTELLGDESFRTQALDPNGPWKDHLPKAGKGKELDGETLERERKSWEAREVTPREEKLKAAGEEITQLRRDRLHGDILATAARLGAKKWLLDDQGGTVTPPIVAMLEQRYGWDDKTRSWALKTADGFAYSAKPTAKMPLKGVVESLAEFATDKVNAELFERTTQGGANLGNTSGGSAHADLASLPPEQRLTVARQRGLK